MLGSGDRDPGWGKLVGTGRRRVVRDGSIKVVDMRAEIWGMGRVIKLRHPLSAVLPFVCLLAYGCGGGANTDFPPPANGDSARAAFPAEIGGNAVEIETLDLDAERYEGMRGKYGEAATILIVRAIDQEAMDAIIENDALPLLEGYSTRMSGRVNGKWGMRGSGGPGRIQGWQNQAWLFVVTGSSDPVFDELVEKFPYISKK
jgi:hypothetical protein